MPRLIRVASALGASSAAGVGVCALAACSVLFDPSGFAGESEDAGTTADVTNDAGTEAEAEAAVDAAPPDADAPVLPEGIPADCELLVKDDFTGFKSDPRWSVLPAAKIGDGEAVLTEADSWQSGGMTMATPSAKSYTRVFARFVFRYAARVGEQGADGMTFFWTPNDSFTLGAQGSDLAICGGQARNGYAFVLNTLSLRVGLWDLPTCGDVGRSEIDVTPFAASQPVVIDVANGEIAAKVGAASYRKTLASMPAIKRIGFTAATAALAARHAVANVAIYVCP